MKLAQLADKTAVLLPFLRCPLCGQGFSLRDGRSLVCARHHCYDLSSKGYINLAPDHNQDADPYDAVLFESRKEVFAAGYYTSLVNLAQQLIAQRFPAEQPLMMLDAGCGEGYYSREMASRFPAATVLGLDLSRAAITAAAKRSRQAHWLVGNLARLPIADHCLQVLLNILTPADYHEFERVLLPEGVLLKVVPGNQYLQEIRQALAPVLWEASYSNAPVLEHLSGRVRLLEQQSLLATLPVTPAQAQFFLRMTPMTFGLPPQILAQVTFPQITIHLEVLLCAPK